MDLTEVRDDASTRPFTLDDADDAMRAALDENGFLHLRGVFTADEVAALGAEVERGRAKATPDDGKSWWAKQADGTDVCCRLIYMGEWSPLVAELGDDPRLRRLAALGADGLEVEADCLDGQSVVIKNPDVTAGLSDLPWHRDCGLGGHPVLCPSVVDRHPARPRLGRHGPAQVRRRLAPRVVAPAATGRRGVGAGRPDRRRTW